MIGFCRWQIEREIALNARDSYSMSTFALYDPEVGQMQHPTNKEMDSRNSVPVMDLPPSCGVEKGNDMV